MVTSSLNITCIRIINMTTDMRETIPEVAEVDGEMTEEVEKTLKREEVGEMIGIEIEEVGEVGPEGVSEETGIMRETEDIRIRISLPVQILRPVHKVLQTFS